MSVSRIACRTEQEGAVSGAGDTVHDPGGPLC